ncbi:hypothetical protein ABBQ38_008616 [Trebouxia sp. C0009 RCD-2024]
MNPRRLGPKSNSTWEYASAMAEAPAPKTTEDVRAAARRGDASLQADVATTSAHHPVKQTGVQGSHALQGLPKWKDHLARKPDPMHCGGDESKAVFDMVIGGTGKVPAYSSAALGALADWECTRNNRFTLLRDLQPGT